MVSEDRLRDIVEASSGGCCGIVWALGEDGRLRHSGHYYTQLRRIEGVHWQKSLKGLYATASAAFSFAPGEGAVGAAFAAQRPLFMPDLLRPSEEMVAQGETLGQLGTFLRADLAKEYGIRSAAFLPAEGGIVEVGCASPRGTLADVLPASVVEAVASGAELPAAVPRRFTPKQEGGRASPLLVQLVEASHVGCYGIEWTVPSGRSLTCKGYYSHQRLVEAAQERGLKNVYAERSSTFAFAAGQGAVGSAFAEQRRLFVRNVQAPLEDELQSAISGDPSSFMRANLAREFGVRSAAFLPSKDGVIEVGSTQEVDALADLLPESALAAAGL